MFEVGITKFTDALCCSQDAKLLMLFCLFFFRKACAENLQGV